MRLTERKQQLRQSLWLEYIHRKYKHTHPHMERMNDFSTKAITGGWFTINISLCPLCWKHGSIGWSGKSLHHENYICHGYREMHYASKHCDAILSGLGPNKGILVHSIQLCCKVIFFLRVSLDDIFTDLPQQVLLSWLIIVNCRA